MNRSSSESIVKPNLKEGDTVMAKIFPLKKGIQYPRYDGPYIIIKLLSKWSYRLKHCTTGQIIDRNYYHVKKCSNKLRAYVGYMYSGKAPRNIYHYLTRNIYHKQTVQNDQLINIDQVANTSEAEIPQRYPKRNCKKTMRYGFDT